MTHRVSQIRRRRRRGLRIAGLVLVVLSVGASVAGAADLVYFAGNNCCSNRNFSGSYVYETANAANDADGQVLCVQEQVFPNWPSGSGAFFDNYKCNPTAVSHSLNGQNVDRAVCWINGGSVSFTCDEHY